ncbi:alpha-amylase family glycosyl hydrolase [Haliovirga abyssi]|uniref:Glycosyl hydrolase family 13 catalytic domain-containing protein n=1 Tax=Haliovirga abyssi TaxID=2996794 RepID=A0AAU9D5Q1_9FUSO|nr:alpha-amylase family glycosyl hydrolase [Haliovirga abyssi]BDU51304.1 hypothetical protein HLVA_18730 [Haliovirga abyssi]
MKRVSILITAFLVFTMGIYADWNQAYLKGSANSWQGTQMTYQGNHKWELEVTFANGDSGGGPRFKIDRYGDWAESYPAQDYTVDANKTYTIVFYDDTKAITATPKGNPVDAWYIRGSFNGWAADALTYNSTTGKWETSITTGAGDDGGGPRFKIDHYGDWTENYPTADYTLNANSDYLVAFDAGTKAITATEQVGPSWYFKGAANNFEKDILTNGEITVTFGADVAFSIVNDDESETYASSVPAGDKKYKITFNETTKAITATEQTTPEDGWFIRGSFNGWAADALTYNSTTGKWETSITTGAGDDGGGPRFKIDHYGDWTENYPTADYSLNANTNYLVAFDAGTKTITAAEQVGPSWYFKGAANNFGKDILTNGEITVTFGADVAFSIVNDDESETYASSVPAGDKEYKIIFNETTKEITATEIVPPVVDMRGRTIYFLMTDRFSDGDPSNNNGNNPAQYSADKSNWRKYFGGDIQGLINKLDYLKNMGITAVWVTPLVDNTDGVDETYDQVGYHGYWAKDFYEVDEHLGDWALVKELDKQMEKRGMKLVLDFALNHSNPAYTDEYGALYKDGVKLTDHPNDGPTRYFDMGGKQWAYGNYYHHNGGIDAAAGDWDIYPNYIVKDMYGLADFCHKSQLTKNYLIGAAEKWMDAGVDAFRLDAVKHIDGDFIKEFTTTLNDYAINTLHRTQGVYFFGEWYDAGAGNSASINFANSSGSAVLDFQMKYKIEGAIADDSTMKDLSNYVKQRANEFNSPDWQPTFMDNHDARRTATYLKYVKGWNDENYMKQRIDLGIELLEVLPGIPVVYYGTEQYTSNGNQEVVFGQVKTGEDPWNREMMPSFDTTTPLYGELGKLSNLRANSSAVQKGAYNEKWVNDDVLVFERVDGNDVVTVAVNRGAHTTLSVSGLAKSNGTYQSILGSDSVSVSNGSATFDLSTNEMVVLH